MSSLVFSLLTLLSFARQVSLNNFFCSLYFFQPGMIHKHFIQDRQVSSHTFSCFLWMRHTNLCPNVAMGVKHHCSGATRTTGRNENLRKYAEAPTGL